jgi:hypothetical protein
VTIRLLTIVTKAYYAAAVAITTKLINRRIISLSKMIRFHSFFVKKKKKRKKRKKKAGFSFLLSLIQL